MSFSFRGIGRNIGKAAPGPKVEWKASGLAPVGSPRLNRLADLEGRHIQRRIDQSDAMGGDDMGPPTQRQIDVRNARDQEIQRLQNQRLPVRVGGPASGGGGRKSILPYLLGGGALTAAGAGTGYALSGDGQPQEQGIWDQIQGIPGQLGEWWQGLDPETRQQIIMAAIGAGGLGVGALGASALR